MAPYGRLSFFIYSTRLCSGEAILPNESHNRILWPFTVFFHAIARVESRDRDSRLEIERKAGCTAQLHLLARNIFGENNAIPSLNFCLKLQNSVHLAGKKVGCWLITHTHRILEANLLKKNTYRTLSFAIVNRVLIVVCLFFSRFRTSQFPRIFL